MLTKIQKLLALAAMFVFVLLVADVIQAQPPEPPAKRLRNPAVVKGFIGGESHDSYVIRAAKGKTMTVQISWRHEGENEASFSVSDKPGFFEAEPVTFGEESDGGKRWTGKIPKTANYYIYVVAHPSARYTLRVTLK
jgi:hypothetical protein